MNHTQAARKRTATSEHVVLFAASIEFQGKDDVKCDLHRPKSQNPSHEKSEKNRLFAQTCVETSSQFDPPFRSSLSSNLLDYPVPKLRILDESIHSSLLHERQQPWAEKSSKSCC